MRNTPRPRNFGSYEPVKRESERTASEGGCFSGYRTLATNCTAYLTHAKQDYPARFSTCIDYFSKPWSTLQGARQILFRGPFPVLNQDFVTLPGLPFAGSGLLQPFQSSKGGDGCQAQNRKRLSSRATDLEKRLWEAADRLRANSELKSHEYSAPVLGLIFLRYADHKFTQAQAKLAKQGGIDGAKPRRTIGKADYQAQGVLYLPENARFSKLLGLRIGRHVRPVCGVCRGRLKPTTRI